MNMRGDTISSITLRYKKSYVFIVDFPAGSVVKSLPANVGDDKFDPWVRKIPWRRKQQPTPVFFSHCSWSWCFWTMVLEKTLESPLDCKQIKSLNPKGTQPWIFIGNTAAEAEVPILWPPDEKSPSHWKRPWCWERLKAGGEGDDRGWDGWMASLTRWTWVWANSGSWWWTGRPDVLQFMGSQRVKRDWDCWMASLTQ